MELINKLHLEDMLNDIEKYQQIKLIILAILDRKEYRKHVKRIFKFAPAERASRFNWLSDQVYEHLTTGLIGKLSIKKQDLNTVINNSTQQLDRLSVESIKYIIRISYYRNYSMQNIIKSVSAQELVGIPSTIIKRYACPRYCDKCPGKWFSEKTKMYLCEGFEDYCDKKLVKICKEYSKQSK